MKRILLVADEPDWVFDSHAKQITKRLTEYEIHTVYRKFNIPMIQNNYDCIYIFDPMPLKHGYPLDEKCIMGLRCEFLYLEHPKGARGLYYEGFPGRCSSIHDKCSLFHVVNKNQFNVFSEFVQKPLMLVQHGVDETIFFDDGNNFKHKEFTVGVSGRFSKLKGFDIVQNACLKKGYKFLSASYGNNKLSKEQMPQFYRQLDVFICMSETEGLHNPSLECGACGIPLITTHCGASDEFIKDGLNGLFVERNVESLISALEKIENYDFRVNLGKNLNEEIFNNWIWKVKIEDFRKMFGSFFALGG